LYVLLGCPDNQKIKGGSQSTITEVDIDVKAGESYKLDIRRHNSLQRYQLDS
jgi:hypothetical protein